MENFLNTKEASKYLASKGWPLSKRTLEQYRYNKQGPSYHKFGSFVRYRPIDLDLWIMERTRFVLV